MPYLSITTNANVDDGAAFVAEASRIVSSGLGKPESYVMAALQPVQAMSFGGSAAPAAFLEVRSIGLPRDLSKVSQGLTQAVTRHTGVPAERVYIAYGDVSAARWAHAGETFA